MNILVIAGCCLLNNSSANLCHMAYIDGMIQLGNDVDLLTYSDSPEKRYSDSDFFSRLRNIYTYNGISLYEKLSARQKENQVNVEKTTGKSDNTQNSISIKTRILNIGKKLFWSAYGIYNPSISWYWRAKKFKSDNEYDMVVSLSYPMTSHLVAKRLIEKKHIKTKHWIQIWEDPWTFDPAFHKSSSARVLKRSYKAEKKLLDACKDILYVSPITLKTHQDNFPDSKKYMRWLPLPSYYQDRSEKTKSKKQGFNYGYFGDYPPCYRDLTPFYNVAVKKNLYFDICGSPYGLLESNNNITVNPRLPLEELKSHEAKTDVLVCLMNKGGGQIPGKIYQYAATNKYVIVILDGTDEEKLILKDFFSQYNRFIFCENTEESIEKTVDLFERGDFSGINNLPLDAFSPAKIAEKLLEVE